MVSVEHLFEMVNVQNAIFIFVDSKPCTCRHAASRHVNYLARTLFCYFRAPDLNFSSECFVDLVHVFALETSEFVATK